jgi:3-hydroxyisobutyrate dehydrogenase-like beta-hydroxyacid dehydrogenase
MNIGFIGLGKMGRAMARNLIRAGHGVTAWNRTRSRAEELRSEGALVADTPADACRGEAVITCLADDRAVEEIVFGENGLAGALAAGGIHISMSTISLNLAERLTRSHDEAGQQLIAAPVFGRPDAAAEARLIIVAAGPAEAREKCRPLFEALGQRTCEVGDNPTVSVMTKLAGNFLLVSAIESLSEAVTLLRKSGTDPQVCLDVLTNTLFAAPVYKNYSGLIVQQKYDPGFRLALGLKDVRLVLAAAESFDTPMPTASLIRDRLLSGIARGYQDKDLAALALICAEDAGLSESRK